ncbi:hypothetical protein [Halolamina salifodinae]|uniref:Uncharacterized protein n=1 Tax=Halolamina salifodinae TaxID=1202767 RepID=A0A8T4GUI2_9EURY|nr:hypothetical protein [Halolamina salifodinae]MBP1986771.1 hypothetical protein [Halolamina salifodinae]
MSWKTLLLVLFVLSTLLCVVAPVSAAPSDTTTETPKEDAETPSADEIVRWAEQGRDISVDRATELMSWLTSEGVSELSAQEYQQVSKWLTSQMNPGSESGSSTTDRTTVSSSDDSDESNYQQAQDAISDGQVSEGELGEEWTITDRQIGSMTVVSKEFEGDQATFIYRLSQPSQVAYSDDIRYQQGLETPIHTTGTQTSGLHVVQLKTMEHNGREQVGFQVGGTKRWVSNGVEGNSNIVQELQSWLTVGNVLISVILGAASFYSFLRVRLWYRSWKHTYTGYSRWF